MAGLFRGIGPHYWQQLLYRLYDLPWADTLCALQADRESKYKAILEIRMGIYCGNDYILPCFDSGSAGVYECGEWSSCAMGGIGKLDEIISDQKLTSDASGEEL